MTVDAYLDAAPEPQQSTLRAVRSMIRELVPDGEEGLSYGVPAMRLGGTPVAGYAWFAGHCGYYPHSGSVLSEVEPELLEGYDWAKGTLRFPIDRPPDQRLIARLVELRIAMME